MQLDHKNYPVSALLDLPAAFDTSNHDILITWLSSWFGIHGFVLNWFKSYLSSRSIRVNCSNSLSSSHTSLCVFLKVLSCTLHHVHHPTEYSDLVLITQPPPLCRWHSFSSLFIHPIFTLASLTSKMLYNKFVLG